MAIGWLTALKAIPWSDVMAAAPHVVRGAKRLVEAARTRRGGADAAGAPVRGTTAERLEAAEAEIAGLKSDHAAAGELLRSLAEQNVRLVDAVERLRLRTRILMGVSLVLAIGFLGLAAWLASR